MELSEAADQLGMRNRNEALWIEGTLAKERNGDRNFKPGPAEARGVWHERDERAILGASRHA
jgi:hypothetical protein